MKNALIHGTVFLFLLGLFAFVANGWELPFKKAPPKTVAWCDAHDVELDACDICNPVLARGGTQVTQLREPDEGECPNTCLRIELAPGVAERIGLETVPLSSREVDEVVHANAESRFPPDKYARVAPRTQSVIREIKATVGDEVEKDAVLSVLESTEVSRVKANYIRSISVFTLKQKTHDQMQEGYPKITTHRQMATAEADLENARVDMQMAEQELSTLGLTSEQIAFVRDKKDSSPRIELRAPFAGIITDAIAVPGEISGPDRPIFTIADLDRMWLVIDIFEGDLQRVEAGQKVGFFLEGVPGRRFPGKVVAIGGEVDDRSRTIRVFADVKNVKGLLRANMFGRAEIRIRSKEPQLLLPKAALQDDGDCLLAFVTPTKDTYIPRAVEVGTVFEGGYAITAGLSEGETVVTTGSFLLKTEILRGQIGAG